MPFRYITARWLSCLKVMAALLVAGLAAGCAFGMARMDAELVDSGVQTVDSVHVSMPAVGEMSAAGTAWRVMGAAWLSSTAESSQAQHPPAQLLAAQ